jgi:tetratricopeptide (TPR) repeat protein
VPTLYELLDALPEDDADSVRAAFRKAAKTNHPDNNPDDPDAPQRFRRVVRAYRILGDEAQRATYDACLAKVQQQRALNSRRNISSQLRDLLPATLGGMVIAIVSIGAFLLAERASMVRVVPAHVQEISATASALTAAMPAQPSGTVGRAGEPGKLDDVAPHEPEAPGTVEEITAPVAVASADNAAAIPAPSDVPVKDARYYRERGGLAYRSGDLPLALVDFDLAIELDPNFSDAYIDRAVVFRRMGDLKHALADVAQAKRIDELKPEQTAPLSGNN